MKRIWISLSAVAMLGACVDGNMSHEQKATATGAVAGAALGAALNDDHALTGAAVGGLLGAGVGALIGKNESGQCVYRDSAGRKIVRDC